MNPIVWMMQVGLREVVTSPRLHCYSAERLGFKSLHFQPRGCTVIRRIHEGGRCLGLCAVNRTPCWDTLGTKGGRWAGSGSPDGIPSSV